MTSGKNEVVDTEMDHDEELIDDEQLEEYQEMVDQLGTFPDKVKINTLSMIAEDHCDSSRNAKSIYDSIRGPLVSEKVSSDRKLPLVYVVDSILKNVKGTYIPIIEKDVSEWMPIVHKALSEDKRVKLKKVWNLWRDARVFSESSWREMGDCFTDSSGEDTATLSSSANSKLENAGITCGKDGGLLLMPKLREAMQCILDDLQSDVQDELEKVSLERLANIDPDLIIKIKRTAEDSLRNGTNANNETKTTTENENDSVTFIVETRTPETIERSKAWMDLKVDPQKEAQDMIATLQQLVRDSSSSENRFTRDEAIAMTGALAAAATTASILTQTIKELQIEEKKQKKKAASNSSVSGSGASGTPARGFFAVDKKLFTNDGIKKKNDAVIGILYEIGLPFVSSSDGRRFATQLELSKHLDALFKKGQLEKTIARTEERGWYQSDAVWSGEAQATDSAVSQDGALVASGSSGAQDNSDPESSTMPADESRDRCVICGINFKMFFDNDDGIYKYSNCREIEVMNDDAAEKESEEMLVHVTCWRGLGSPTVLTQDQALQDAMAF